MKKRLFIKWQFTKGEMVSVVNELIENLIDTKGSICSIGEGDIQFDGLDITEGKIEINWLKFTIYWESDKMEISKDFWMSPYCFTSKNGEAIKFGQI